MLPKGSVSGTVLDSATGKAITDFSIAVARPKGSSPSRQYSPRFGKPRFFHSDTGEFVVENVDLGSATLRASATGHTPQDAPDVEVESGRVTSGITFRLPAGNVIRGTVIAASDSRPIARAGLYVDALSEEPWLPDEEADAVTGTDGSFVLKDLPEGKQPIRADHPDFAPGSVVVEVEPGKEIQMSIQLSRGGTIAGYVRDDGAPVHGANLNLHSQDRSLQEHTDTFSDGYYEFTHLPSGTYELNVRVGLPMPPFEGRKPDKEVTVKVEDGRTTNQDFDLKATAAN
jgi:hypothetical protein